MSTQDMWQNVLRGPIAGAGIGLLALVAAVGLASCGSRTETQRAAAGDPVGKSGVARAVRIDDGQYKQIIADIFGPTLVLDARLAESQKRSAGLLAVGDSEVSFTSAGFESAENMAQLVANQVVDAEHRDTLMPCKPVDARKPDGACARQFLGSIGRLLFRRGLAPAELDEVVRIAHDAATRTQDFYSGASFGLARLLVSPNFLFRIERAIPDEDHAGKYRLTAYSKAGRLSALLWNSNPDDELLAAAERGDLESKQGLRQQVDRMLASPKLEHGVRAFFSDMLEFDKFEMLGKDTAIYPQFTPNLPNEIREQALRVIVHELLAKQSDYRQLFLTHETFLTPSLAALSGIELSDGVNNGEPDRWVRYTYPANDSRAGFLALPAFTALHSLQGRSSPTLRGRALRQNLLCQVVPDPPAGVDFELFNSGKAGATARERLTAHNSNPSCAGCHKIMDPIGLALEHFDGSGRRRQTENGHVIDTRGNLDGVPYEDATGLARAVSDSPNLDLCLANRIYSYGMARPLTAADRPDAQGFRKDFSKHGRRLPELLRSVATADVFYLMTLPKPSVADARTMENQQIRVSQTSSGATQ